MGAVFRTVGLAAMRLQPLHLGHCLTISRMIQECDVAIIGLGSTEKHDEHDPFDSSIRMQMLRNVYGDRIKIIPLNDINAGGKEEWVSYLFEKVKKLGMPQPTDYYTGSLADANWYNEHFSLDHSTHSEQFLVFHEGNPVYFRKLHIVDRDNNDIPSATELRTFLKLRSNEWRKYIPRVNWKLVEENFPKEYIVPAK